MSTLRHTLYWLGHALYEWLYTLLRRPRFLPYMARLLEWSVFRSPYLAAKREGASAKALTYGEITLSTIDDILRMLHTTPHDLFFDLGSGRGRVVLYAAATYGIPARGVELLPGLVDIANYARNDLALASFEQGDLLHTDLSHATIIWIVGTCWHQDTFDALASKISALDHQPTIISVSAPLPNIPIQHIHQGSTSWGRDQFFVQGFARRKTPQNEHAHNHK